MNDVSNNAERHGEHMLGKFLLTFSLVGSILILLWTGLADAASVTLVWNKNTESDLAGYKVYMSEESGVYGAPFSLIDDKNASTAIVNFADAPNARTKFFVLTAYDLSGNESPFSSQVSKLIPGIVIVIPKPSPVMLTVVATGPNSVRVTWPFVDDGTGAAAKVNVRFAVGVISWGSATSASCTVSPCDLTDLLTDTLYGFQGVSYRPTPTGNVFGVVQAPLTIRTLKDTTPPPPPTGLTVTKNTIDQVIVVAKAADCRSLAVNQSGSTVTDLQMIVNCVR